MPEEHAVLAPSVKMERAIVVAVRRFMSDYLPIEDLSSMVAAGVLLLLCVSAESAHSSEPSDATAPPRRNAAMAYANGLLSIGAPLAWCVIACPLP